jgi:hypothetical protein
VKLVAVSGAVLGFGAGSVISGGIFTITSTPSTDAKVDGLGVYRGPLTWTFAGGAASGFVSVIGSGSIPPGSLSVEDDALAVILLGDSCTGSFTATASNGATTALAATVEVSSAGQSSVQAD